MSGFVYCSAAAPFEAARRLPAAGGDPAHQRLHGHSFRAYARLALAGAPAAGAFAGGEVDALRERLHDCVAPLDYQLLNERLDCPSDEALAQWICARLGGAGVALVGVRGAPDAGVEIGGAGRALNWRRFRFQAAHCLPKVPRGHKCGRMHGHGFAAVLRAHDDAALIDRAWAPLQARLQHACLNDLPGLQNPTSECLAAWVWRQLAPHLPGLRWVSVHETASCGAHFDGQEYRIWKDTDIDSAVRLENAPRGDPRAGVHGHSYRLRLHLQAPLDAVLGWTIDFGDVKERFTPLFERLDHHPLHEIPGVAQHGSAGLARWVHEQARAGLPQLERVDVYETPDCGVIHCRSGAPATVYE